MAIQDRNGVRPVQGEHLRDFGCPDPREAEAAQKSEATYFAIVHTDEVLGRQVLKPLHQFRPALVREAGNVRDGKAPG
jgi:hypothetical protein